MDADILAADAATLEKIKAQDARDAMKANAARDALYQQAVNAYIGWQAAKESSLPAELDLRQQVTLTIADKYMTTSTAIDPALILQDAQRDAARLKAAVDEVMKTLTP